MIEKGNCFLRRASNWNILSKYFLEASIAYWHTIKVNTKDKWENILQLYNLLLQLEYSPIAALNRTFALSKAKSNEIALMEAEKLNLSDNHFYHILVGELCKDVDNKRAKMHFQTAFSLAKTQTEKHTIKKKIDQL